MSLQHLKDRIARFHRDEDGLEAVQVVMIVAILLMILAPILAQEVFDWLKAQWNELRGKKIS